MKNYFSHDEGARNDPKLIKVLMRLGQAGKGVYWDLVEMLYEEDGYLQLSACDEYAFALRTDCELIKSLINDFGLFENDGVKFWSNSVLFRLNLRLEKSKKASESAAKRWKSANAMRTHSDGNANKVNKSIVNTNNTPNPIIEPDGKARCPLSKAPLPFQTENFIKAWNLWLSHLKELNTPYSKVASQLALQELVKLSANSEPKARELIKLAITKRWKNIYESDYKSPLAKDEPLSKPSNQTEDLFGTRRTVPNDEPLLKVS